MVGGTLFACSAKQVFLKPLQNSQKTSVREFLSNRVAPWRLATFLNKRFQHGYFPVDFAKL